MQLGLVDKVSVKINRETTPETKKFENLLTEEKILTSF